MSARLVHTVSNDTIAQWVRQAQAREPLDWMVVFQHFDPWLRALCYQLSWPQHDREDTLQEARIALYQAMLAFDPDRGTSLSTFIRLVVQRQLASRFRYHTRQARHARVPVLSWDARLPPSEPGAPSTLADITPAPHQGDPLDAIIDGESLTELLRRTEQVLTDREWRVLMAYWRTPSITRVADHL